jgi:hypothetical protein
MGPSTASRADLKVVTRANIDVMTIAAVTDRLQSTDTNGATGCANRQAELGYISDASVAGSLPSSYWTTR